MDRSAEKGWELLENGELIREAEEDGYGIIVTAYQNMRYQQNLASSQLAIIVLMATAWPRVQHRTKGPFRSLGNNLVKTLQRSDQRYGSLLGYLETQFMH